MVNGIPIYKVEFSEGLVKQEASAGNLFAYAVEADRGPVGEPILITSAPEAKRIFGLNFAPHFYQKGAPIYICRVGFPEMENGSITYKANVASSGEATVNVIKITAATPGPSKHKVLIVKSPTSNKKYNVTITIDGVGSKKYQNISSLSEIVNRINNKFSDYITAELLIDEKQALGLLSTESLVKTSDNKFEKKNTEDIANTDVVICTGPFDATRLKQNLVDGKIDASLTGGSYGKLRKVNGAVSDVSIPSGGFRDIPQASIGTEDESPSIDATLAYAYREAFEILENKDVIGVATLSNSEVVQNELVEHINKLIDPEVYKYRFGITGLLDYPKEDSNGVMNATDDVNLTTLTSAATHIDNPFVIMIGEGVVFEEDGVKYNLLPHEATQLYTGLRSSIGYGESIYGGNSKKVLTGVRDIIPVVSDGSDISKEDIESINESGLITFKKEYEEITFLEGVTTAQDSPVLSHESVMMIVLHVLKRLVRVSRPFHGEPVTEDLKSSLVNALNNELKNITDTDKTLIALDDYNIPPYAVDVQTTVMAGFNEAGEYIRETHYLVTVKIVPIGTLRSLTLSVVVI